MNYVEVASINYSTHIAKSSSILSILNCWMLLTCQLLLTNNYNLFTNLINLINDKMFLYFRDTHRGKPG